ncbi:unnamed protein product [Sympodiomycopsis kandeliae]
MSSQNQQATPEAGAVRTPTSEKSSDGPETIVQDGHAVSKSPSSEKFVDEYGEKFYSNEEERKLVRKVDLVLLPTLTLLYLLSFLDRSNIGNAKIAGLATDLKLGDQYPTALTLFFVGYVLFEVPANWGLKATNPPFWMASITLLFGVVSLTQGLVTNTSGLLAVRFFLGIAEAGLFPGTVFIFSQWYQRKERVARVAFFFSAAAAAGASGGILAYAIGFMDGIGGKRGWEWIFILEGLLTIVVACIAYFTIPHYPTKTKWFTEREVAILKHRLGTDSDAIQDEGFNWDGAKQAFTDPKVYLYCLLFHGMSFALYTVSLFLPTIISGLGYKTWQAQLLTIPPYVFAFLATMTTAWTAQRVKLRAPFIIGGASVAVIGYIVLITSPTVGGRYVSVFLCVAGIYSANALLLAWPSENVAGATKRNTAVAMMISIGNCGAIIGTAAIYRQPLGSNANTNYKISHGITIIWLFIAITAASTIYIVLGRENRRRNAIIKDKESRGETDQPKSSEETAKEWRELGDFKLDWRYQL